MLNNLTNIAALLEQGDKRFVPHQRHYQSHNSHQTYGQAYNQVQRGVFRPGLVQCNIGSHLKII